MARLVSLLVWVLLLATPVRSQAASGLTPQQIPSDCKVFDGDFPTDPQTGILWQKTEMYQGVIPVPVAKNAQSFDCGGDQGTLYLSAASPDVSEALHSFAEATRTN
jgi:hypothetical protein